MWDFSNMKDIVELCKKHESSERRIASKLLWDNLAE